MAIPGVYDGSAPDGQRPILIRALAALTALPASGSFRGMPPTRPALSPLRVFAGLVALAVAGLITYLSLIPAAEVPGAQFSDKLNHFVAYAALAAPLTGALGSRRWAGAALLATFLGLGLEVAQSLGGGDREGSVGDALANLVGALLGAGLARAAARFTKRH